MVSHALGRPATIEEASHAASNPFGRESVQRMSRHMEANGIKDAPIILGRTCAVNAANEGSSDPDVHALFSRTCREPFSFPTHGS
jgi:hypothetical protein